MTARYHLRYLARVIIALVLFQASAAYAACSSPLGNAGDIIFSSTSNIMVYCNGTSWVGMGQSTTTTYGTMTTGNFCTATSGSAIACSTATVNMATQVTGTLGVANGGTGAATITGNGIVYGNGTSALGVTAAGTANYLLQANGSSSPPSWTNAPTISGVNITGIGTSGLGGITGTPSSSTFLRGDGTWSAASGSGSLPTLTSANIWVGNGSNVATAVAPSGDVTISNAGATTVAKIAGVTVGTPTGTGNVVMSASPILTGTVTGAGSTWTGTHSFQLASDYTTTGSQADVAVNTASAVRYNGSAVATFYGIVAGQNGQILVLHNASSSVLTLSNQSGSESTAANKIITGTGADLAMASNSSVIMQYDNTAARWRVIGGSGGGGGSGTVTSSTVGQVGYFASTGTTIIGTTTLNVSGGQVGIGTATPLDTLDVYGTGIHLASGTPGSTSNILYNNSGTLVWNGATLVNAGGGTSSGGGNLIGVYTSSTAVSNYSIVFTGAANSSPSLSGTTLTLPSNTNYIVVETWGGGGGGGANGTTNGNSGNQTCFGTNSTACTSPTVSATGGGGGVSSSGSPQAGGAGGVGSGGDINLTGAVGNFNTSNLGGIGGSSPLGGGGGSAGASGVAGGTGGSYGGGGGGSYAGNSGGGGGGGYARKLINSPSGTYYYTIGGGASAVGSSGSTLGGAGGTGGITISVYASGVTSGSVGTGAVGNVAYYNAAGTAISPFTGMTLSGSNVGIGTTSPNTNLEIGNITSSSTATPVSISLGGTYSSTAGANPKLKLWDAGSAYYGFGVSNASLDIIAGQASGQINFYVNANASPSMTISNGGNVGIGSSSPAARLDLGGGNIKMGYSRVTNSCGAATQCWATCPAGTQVLGGGCWLTSSWGHIEMAPDSNTTYTCESDSSSITVYAVCANIQ